MGAAAQAPQGARPTLGASAAVFVLGQLAAGQIGMEGEGWKAGLAQGGVMQRWMGSWGLMVLDARFDLFITRDYLTGNRTSGYSLIDSTRVTCASSAVCDALEQKLGSPDKFRLDMRYPATEGDPLIIQSLL
jgi:hypothetical protein